MATDFEIRKYQKAFLRDLLKIKNGSRSVDDVIGDYKAEMAQEDFAYVVKVTEQDEGGLTTEL